MNPDYFLFGIGIFWIAFASIQDLRKREVANWLNFSLIFLGLTYRIAYGLYYSNPGYIRAGAASFIMFCAIAYALYYGKAFAGGDAKLLMGVGTLIPGDSLYAVISNGLIFIFVLLIIGALWSIFALFTPLAPLKWKSLKKEINKRKIKYYIYTAFLFALAALGASFVYNDIIYSVVLLIFSIIIGGYPILKAADSGMVIKVRPKDLVEGDWILEDIKIGNKTIKKTVHGLSYSDIKLIRHYGKTINVKAGVPFVPAFMISFIIMVFFWVSGNSLVSSLWALV